MWALKTHILSLCIRTGLPLKRHSKKAAYYQISSFKECQVEDTGSDLQLWLEDLKL